MERSHNGAKREIGRVTDTKVETGRWYDVKVEVQGLHIRCYLDGELITEANDDRARPIDPLYTTASLDEKTGEVIIKVVNVSESLQPLKVSLEGVEGVVAGRLDQIQGNPRDVNTIAMPRKVAPTTSLLGASDRTFEHRFPPYSISVLRLKTR